MSSANYEGHGPAQLTEAAMPSSDPTVGPTVESPVVGLPPSPGNGVDVTSDVPTPPPDVAPGTVRRAKAGDDGAFAALIEHYDPMLREFAFHLLGDHIGMDEVLQGAYVKAYRALPRLRADVAPRCWLYRIAYLACLDVLRRRYRRPPQTTGRRDDADAPRSAFSRAFAGLPADQRAAVLLTDRGGLGTAAVAEVVGQSEVVAIKTLTRARTVLHAALDEDAESELDVR